MKRFAPNENVWFRMKRFESLVVWLREFRAGEIGNNDPPYSKTD